MFNRLMAKRKTGFTLVEILVVILIIGLLFVFLVPKIDSSTDKARETGIKTDMRSYQTAFEAVAREHGGLGENAITDEAKAIQLINGYLDPALKIGAATDAANGAGYDVAKQDPWNNEYIFTYAAKEDSNNGYVSVRTMGKDMRNTYVQTDLVTAMEGYELDAAGKVTGSAVNACLDTDLETARIGGTGATLTSDQVDDYVLGTWYLDGQIFSATAGFTTNIESGILAD
jgi:prepilin-type N-terminal cleavage/methylation domain-containing protein